MTTLFRLSFAFLVTTFSAFTFAQNITITEAWARTTPPGAPGAGYMHIYNGSESDDRLIAVEGDFARKLEVHLSAMEEGVMKMKHLHHGVDIPAKGMLMLAPGSYHLMFMGLNKPMASGEHYKITLVFEKAGNVDVMLPVKEGQKMIHTH